MVFPSVPIYFDSPNWPQQQGRDASGGSSENNGHHQIIIPPPPSSNFKLEGGGGATSSIKPDSMTDRARAAKIPHLETALKCPRCESTNTKFCYFNNYSLTQPRHLCKTCRRYWTRGGALRNVPVGGGFRRNKRSTSKGTRSKSPATGANTSVPTPAPATTSSDVMMGHFSHLPNFLTHLSQNQYGGSGDVAGLSSGGIQAPSVGVRGNGNNNLNNNDVEFQMNVGGGFVEQWRHFPFLNGGVESPATGNMYTFEYEGGAGIEPPESNYSIQIGSNKAMDTSMASVKVEGNNQVLNLSRNFLGISGGGGDQNQYWVGGAAANAWTELAGFSNSSSSTRHLL